MHLRGLVLLLFFLPGRTRRTVRVHGFHNDAQLHDNILANGIGVSAEARWALIPRGFGARVFHRAGRRAGVSRQMFTKDGRHGGHTQPRRVAPLFRFSPPRAKVGFQQANSPNEEQLLPKEEARYPGVTWREDTRKWCVQFRHRGKWYSAGSYGSEEEAAHVHDDFVRAIGLDRALHFPAGQGDNQTKTQSKSVPLVKPGCQRRSAVATHCDAHKWQLAETLVRSARADGERIHPGEYGLIIRACDKWESARDVVRMLEEDLAGDGARHPDARAATRVLTCAMRLCGHAGQWHEALGILERMTSLQLELDTRAFNAALSACARAGEATPLMSTLRNMSSADVPFDLHTYTICMDGLARAGHGREALRLFARMGVDGAPKPDKICFNVAVCAAARCEDTEKVLSLLRQMASSGVGVSIEALSSAMLAFSKADRPELALRLFERVEKLGLSHDAVVCSTAISAFAKAGQYAEALALFCRMRRMAGVQRDAVNYKTMLHATWCAAAPTRRARHTERLRALMDLEGVAADDVAYSLLLQSLWHRPIATKILDEAMAKVPPGLFPRCLTVAKVGRGESWELDLHSLSPGAAVAMVLWVLSQLAKRYFTGAEMPLSVLLITGWGKSLEARGTFSQALEDLDLDHGFPSSVRLAVLEALRVCDGVPITRTSANPGSFQLDMPALERWLEGAVVSGLMYGSFEAKDRFVLSLDDAQADAIDRAARRAPGREVP